MMILFLGGVESTAGLTGSLFKLLAENPDQRALLQADPSLIPAAVEEALRLVTPLQFNGRRRARSPCTRSHPQGWPRRADPRRRQPDERQFPDPDTFDITRPRGRHLGFGEGVHGCLGARSPAWRRGSRSRRPCPSWATTSWRARPGFYPSSPNMYVWKHLPVTFGRSGGHRPHVEAVHHRTTTVTLATSEFEAEARVTAKREAADGVITLALRAVDEHPLPPWEAGAHVDLVLGDAPTRQYSLAAPADHHEYRLGILRDSDGRGSSLHVHDRLAVGDTVRLRGPRNNFPSSTRPGTCSSRPVSASRRSSRWSGRPRRPAPKWRLVYGGRRRASMAFLDELARYGERVSIHPQDETGLLDLDSCSALRTRHPRVLWSRRCSPRSSSASRPGAVAARRTLRAEAAGRAGARRGLRGGPAAERAHAHRHPNGPCSPSWGGRVGAVLLRGGHLQYLRNPGPGRRTDHRDSVLDEAERQAERRHDDLRLPCVHRASGAGPVSGVEDRPVGVASSGRGGWASSTGRR